jgi:putative methyltransferase (TIGR04325 family)
MLQKIKSWGQYLIRMYIFGAWRRPDRYRPRKSFQQAVADAGGGYLSETIPERTGAKPVAPSLAKLPDFFAPFFAMLSIASMDKAGQHLRVLDFGGAHGDYAEYAATFFSNRLPAEWNVVETEQYVKSGRERAGPVGFYTSISDIPGDLDVAIFSGVLQYMEDWQSPLSHPKVRAANIIYISRTPMGPKYVPFLQSVRQGAGTVKYAGALLPQNEIEKMLSPTHDMFASWWLDHDMDWLGAVTAPPMIWKKKGS